MSENIMRASHEWASRPDDQRFLSLADLKASVMARKKESWTATPRVTDLRMIANDGDEQSVTVELYDPTHGARREVAPTNWAFTQLAQLASAPAAYLRKLPGPLAAINLQYGLEHIPQREDALFLAQSNGDHRLRAITSTSYGRIWDSEVVEAVERVNADGRWQVPAASYATQQPKRATTLYASDRDVFMFLVDPKNPVEVPGESHPMFRGFYIWNSEVGKTTFGITTFLYRYVCDNRIIWGATDVKEVTIRHTGGAPDRFAYEGAKYLKRYADESTDKLVEGIQKAKALEPELDSNIKDTNAGMAAWLQKRGFTKGQAQASVDAANAEEGRARSLWEIVNGVTAYARSISHADERTDLEEKAGKLMSLAV